MHYYFVDFFLGSRRVRYEKSIFGSSHKVAFDVRRANITRTNVCVFSLRIAIEKYCTEKRSIGWYANKLHHHHLVWQYSVLWMEWVVYKNNEKKTRIRAKYENGWISWAHRFASAAVRWIKGPILCIVFSLSLSFASIFLFCSCLPSSVFACFISNLHRFRCCIICWMET